MSRRNDLIKQLIKSDKFGTEKENEQKFLLATAELILSDLIDIALRGVEAQGAGSLVINLLNDSTTFMSGTSIESDIYVAEREEDADVRTFLRDLMSSIDENDWSKNVLITLISDAGTRTFEVEAGRSQESLRALAEEFSG
tara:strand:+ start:1120 stop:1542 length:423 start_codon:yes stop_codon:yes gene_type:complete